MMTFGSTLRRRGIVLKANQKHFHQSRVARTTESFEKYVYVPVGLVSGFLGALCGVGGGVVIIPALKHFTSLSIHSITATSLTAVTLASSCASIAYIGQGTADLGIAALLGCSAILSSKAGARLNHNLPTQMLTRLMAAFLLASVPALLMKSVRISEISPADPESAVGTGGAAISARGGEAERSWRFYLGKRAPTREALPEWLRENAHYALVGLGTGFTTSLLGIGGGIIMVNYMALSSPLSQHEVVATSLVAMVPTGFAGAWHHMKAGHVSLRAGGLMGATSAVSMYLAAKYVAPHVDETALTRLFAALLGIAALKMLR